MFEHKNVHQAGTDGVMADRTRRYCLKSFLACVLVVALLLAVNVGIRFLPNRLTRKDVVSANVTHVSDRTLDYIRTLDQQVTLYWLCEEGDTDTQFEIFLSRYEDANSCVQVKVVDPLTDERFCDIYTGGELSNFSILVESDRRSRLVDSSELYVYTNDVCDQLYQSTTIMTYDEWQSFLEQYKGVYGAYPDDSTNHIYFYGEMLVTSAIDYVTAPTIPHGYMLTGHGRDTLPDVLTQMLTAYGLTADALDLTGGDTVPSDANCIVLFAPESDLTENEYAVLSAYLEEGGSLLLVTDPASLAACPKAALLGDSFGMIGQEGVVIENDDQYVANSSVYQLRPIANTSQQVSYLLSVNGITARMPQCHGIALQPVLPAGASVTPMLATSDAGNRLSTDGTFTALDTNGKVNVAVAATRNITRTDGTTGAAHMVWFGSVLAFEDEVAAEVSYGNDYYFVFSVAYMSAGFTSSYADIRPLEMTAGVMQDLTVGPAVIWMILIVLILPLGCLTTGLVIWVRRRRR